MSQWVTSQTLEKGVALTNDETIDDTGLVDLIGGQGVGTTANLVLRMFKRQGKTFDRQIRKHFHVKPPGRIIPSVRNEKLQTEFRAHIIRNRRQKQVFRIINTAQAGQHLPRFPRTP